VFGALLTAFYMTRQVCYVFFGSYRGGHEKGVDSALRQAEIRDPQALDDTLKSADLPVSEFLRRLAEVAAEKKIEVSAYVASEPHESSALMVIPLVILAVCSVLLGFIGTPAWPWFEHFLTGTAGHVGALRFDLNRLTEPETFRIMLLSTVVACLGIGLGYWLYGRRAASKTEEGDILERARPDIFALLRREYFVNEIYEWTFAGLNLWWAKACHWSDTLIWGGLVALGSYVVVGLSWASRFIDEHLVNIGFDEGCRRVKAGGGLMSRLQNGRVQNYLRVIGIGLAVLVLALIWGCRAS
jgi:NADH-quinone oxidoreductase subunit L